MLLSMASRKKKNTCLLGNCHVFKNFVSINLICHKNKFWKAALSSGQKAGLGVISYKSVQEMDRLQELSSHPKAFDAVFFMGASREGCYLVISAERRHNDAVHGVFYVMLPGVGLLKSPKLPDTLLLGASKEAFGAEGIHLEPLEAMRKWRVQYLGKARLTGSADRELVDVRVEAEWTSQLPHFDYDTDMDPWAVCRAFARERWSKEFFSSLREAHQTHYEQMGVLKGSITISGKMYPLDMPCFRDHSYGWKRDWKLIHRYAFHTIFLENGQSAVVGVVSHPCTCSWLELGYVCHPKGHLHPVSWCDLKLEHHGERGSPPVDYAFRFAAGGETYVVQVRIKEAPHHYLGADWEARNVERFVTYHVNGLVGWGVSEWNYRNWTGKKCAVGTGF